MPHIALAHQTDWHGFRQAARLLTLAGVEPAQVSWSVGGHSDPLEVTTGGFTLPRPLVEMASIAIQAREQDRFGLLYSLIWRAHAGENVLADEDDPDFRLARRLARAVRADAHRMRTHLRYLPVTTDDGTRYLGWYVPAHYVLEATAQRIALHFPNLAWSIITPDATAHWNDGLLRFGPGASQIGDDATLAAWWEHYGVDMMADATRPAAVSPAEALAEAPRPPDRPAIGPIVLPTNTTGRLPAIARSAQDCDHCPLHASGTQMVFGEGPADARVMFVGEQPGDHEDVIGRPFVGPAGQLMDQAMEAARIDRRMVYVTNAVKHFKYLQRGQRRIHQSPDMPEINACRFWLTQEREAISPKLVVMMGGTAAQSILQRPVTITRERGQTVALPDGTLGFVTVHPSFLLRQPDEAAKARAYDAFVRDLCAIKAVMEAL